MSRAEQLDVFFADSCHWYVGLRLDHSHNWYQNYFERDNWPLNADVPSMVGYAFVSAISTEVRRKVDRLGCFVWLLCFRRFALVPCVWYSLCHIIILGLVRLGKSGLFSFSEER